MPKMFYVPVDDPSFTNAVNYLPEELIPKNPKMTGLMGQYLKPAASGGASKNVRKVKMSRKSLEYFT